MFVINIVDHRSIQKYNERPNKSSRSSPRITRMSSTSSESELIINSRQKEMNYLNYKYEMACEHKLTDQNWSRQVKEARCRELVKSDGGKNF